MDVPAFDPDLHIAPTELFRRLTHGEPLALYDLRPKPPVTLRGALAYEAAELPRDAILLDTDGRQATEEARRLQSEAREGGEASKVRALYGGIELYRFALHPAVVGEERFLTNER